MYSYNIEMKGSFTRRQELKVIDERNEDEFVRELTNDHGNYFLQFATTISVCFSQLGLGALISWSSPSLKYLMSEKSEISLTLKEGAWMTSLSSIGSLIGFLIIALLMDRVGRKYTLLIFAVPQIISWIFIIFAKKFYILYIARIVGGIGYSCVGLIFIYIGEIAEGKIRGMLSILMIISSDLGMLIVAIMGAYLSFNAMNLILSLVPIIFFFSFIFMPESPYFYLMQERNDEAVKSMMRLRRVKNPELVMLEIERIKMSRNENQELKENNWRELFCSKGFIIVMCAHLTVLSSGSLVVIAYAQQIFDINTFYLSPEQSFMILITVKIFSGFLVFQLIERLGRRILYLISGILSALALGFVSLSFFLKLHLQMEMAIINWCPLAGLIIYELVSSGISSLPFVLGGELFPVNVKKLAITIVSVAAAITVFGVELIFPILSEAVGIYVSFFIFSVCCLIGTLFVFSLMPETKGKSLEEIQYILNSDKNNDSGVKLKLLSGKINKYGV